ncbi:MAG: hypothetical protein L3J44_03095 [Campylobacteraceae bacterium]|nr:hypothetical protein [Campylobacteraceae bacterium]
MASIVYGTIGMYINLTVGVFFMAIGYYLYLKASSTMNLINSITKTASEKQETSNAITRFVILEKIFTIGIFLIGAILLMAVVSRMFGEQLPIFG